jgi:hypothetical protein
MKATDPFKPPLANLDVPEDAPVALTLLDLSPAFASGLLAITLPFLVLGVITRQFPDFTITAPFLITQILCAAVASLLLIPLRRTHWLVRVLVGGPLAFLLFFVVIVLLRHFFSGQ